MKHLTILIPEGSNNLSSIVGAYKIFTRANEYWKSLGNESRFCIELAGNDREINLYEGIFAIRPHRQVAEIRKTDLVIIPAMRNGFAEIPEANREMVAWIADQYRGGAALASICTGAFLLAATGLLDGRTCSTHWMAADQFRRMFPKVNLVTDRIITDEHGICTNGGAYSFLNLMLYLVEKFFDRRTALFCAKVFQIEPDRESQSLFTIFTGQKDHDDAVIREAQLYIEQHADDRISMEDLAARFAVGRRNFDRRFKKATGNTPAEYQQRVKVEKAKKSLESTRKNINEIMYESGYNDVKAFRTIFRKFTGLSPLEYRNKFFKVPY